MRQVATGEEFRDVLIGRPVDRNAEIVAIRRFEVGLVLLVVEPVIAEPIEVRELLGRHLVDFAIRTGGEAQADEIVQIQRRECHVRAFARHPVGQVADLLVAPVSADQVAIVDIGVIDVFARLHLGLQLLDHVPFADQVVGDLDAGDGGECRGQHLALVFMRGDGLGNDLDLHAFKRLGGVDKELHFRFLIGTADRRQIADFRIEECLGGLHVGKGRARKDQQRRCGGFEVEVHWFCPPILNR